jgi:hypothetical protein
MSYLNRFATCLLLAISLQAVADTKNLDSALSERTQLEFCATYVPCAIAVGIMDTSSASLSYVDKVKAYFSTFGNKPVKSEAEFKAYLTGLNPSQRQAYVNKCLDARGTNMRDYCEKEYLNESELKKLELSRIKSTPQTELEIIEEEKKKLEALDSKLYNELSSACPSPNALCNVSSIDEGLVRLNRRIEQLNSNPSFTQKFGQFVSKALNRKLIGYELDNGRYWSTRAIPTKQAANAWDNLPSRQPNAIENKNLQALVETNNTANANNPYAGVSDQLNQETIDKKAKSYALTSGIIFGAIDAVNTGVAVAAINRGQKIEQEAERQRQVAMQREADIQAVRNQRTTNTKSNGETSQAVYQGGDGEPATECVQVIREENKWAKLYNQCGFTISVSWCYVGEDCKHGNWGYSSASSIRAGQSYPATTFASKSNQYDLLWAACKGGYTTIREPQAGQFFCQP